MGKRGEMYGKSGDGKLEGAERDRWGEIITRLKRCMATREATSHDQVKRDKKTRQFERKGTKQERKNETTALGMGEDNVPFGKWADKNESQKKSQTWLLANVTHVECAFSFRRTLNTTIPPSAPKTVRVIA